MSRDWTPHEHYAVNKYHEEHGGPTAWDIYEHTVVHMGNETFAYCEKEELALRKQFPLFGFLLNTFPEVHKSLSGIPGGVDLLKKREEELSAYIETGTGDKSSALIRWFEGKLDPCFYYSEHNEELFRETLLEDAKAASKLPLDAVISDASSRLGESVSQDAPPKNKLESVR